MSLSLSNCDHALVQDVKEVEGGKQLEGNFFFKKGTIGREQN